MEQKSIALLEELTKVIGISGDEKEISRKMKDHLEKLCDEVIYDNLGSVFAVKKCGRENAKRVMVCAHMDEVGFMLNEIGDNGLAGFIKIGAVSDAALYGSRVRVKTRTNEVYGIIVADEETATKANGKNMKIDFGVSNSEEVSKLGVMVGDSTVFDGGFMTLENRAIARAIDARFGCALAIEILEALKDESFDFDLYVGASVMEEVGQRGGTTATGLIQPDLGIVLDGGAADDYTGKSNAVGQLGKGVLVRYYDKGMMPNRALLNELVSVCENNQIDYQHYYSMSLTDAAWIHKLFAGCPTLHVGICARNPHTGNAEIDLHDYECAKQSAIEVIKGLTSAKIDAFKESNR
ncbi:M42 family peptidase [[Clostridium] innocuum]|nr:M42 family peptidase [[Clostridium] innocuum]